MTAATTVSPKVTAATAAAALVVILVWVLEYTTGVDLPQAVELAATTVAVFGAGWAVRDPARAEARHRADG